jgi:biopolymer transport protein ExbB/TolQ
VFGLLVASVVLAVAVIIERFIVFKRVKSSTDMALAQLDNWAKTNQWQAAREQITRANRQQAPLFSVLRAGIVYWQELVSFGETRLEVMEALVHDAVTRELKLVRAMLRANLPILANISSVAPFIGLFGTVVGIIMTFQTISKQGNMGPDIVSSGIADALIATAMGLFAAIPAVIAYNYFTDRISQLLLSMEEVALERIYFLVQREQVEPGANRSAPGKGSPAGSGAQPKTAPVTGAAPAPLPVAAAGVTPQPSTPSVNAAVTRPREENPSTPKFTGQPGKE